jgi:AraC family transcriptional regulator
VNWLRSIQATIDRIEADIKGEINVEALAREINSSAFPFQRVFAILCDCTLGEYIRNRRLTLAGREVVESQRPILDIAFDFGYETNESFTRAFTRFHGMTPSAARKGKANITVFPRLEIKDALSGGKVFMNDITERGYVVKETGAVYYTQDMDRTIEWFKKTLGWYGQVDSRDEEGGGRYGCVNNIPIEIECLHIAPFTGIHLFHGAPEKRMAGFMLVQGLENLYRFVKESGWNQVAPINKEAWGGRTCAVTTVDGSILTFFENQ